MLFTTGVKLDLLQDLDQLLFLEKGFRGEINGLGALRHFEANNKYPENLNSNEESTFGAFSDVTSFYAGTIQKEMPVGGYEWCTDVSLSEKLTTPGDSSVGLFVELDLQYPPAIHDVHNNLPLASPSSKFRYKGDPITLICLVST